MENAQKLGFKFLKFLDLSDWKIFELVDSESWNMEGRCPAHNEKLSSVVLFSGNEGRDKIRLGCCKICGYIGYKDLPTKEWIHEFYKNTWEDTESSKVKKSIQKIKEDKDTKQRKVIKILKNLNLDKSRYVCEIGSAYGSTLNEIKKQGFTNLVGIENSKHRVDFAKSFFGFNVFNTPFEDTHTQNELKKIAPFSLIFSHHVFEHVYDPGELMAHASSLQSEGDYFVISLPNAEGEFSASNLFYFPHLHSFTEHCLTDLLKNYNYQVVDNSFTTKDVLSLVAQKTKSVTTKNFLPKNHIETTINKFKNGLSLKNYFFSPRRMWWFRRFDVGGQVNFLHNDFLNKIYWGTLKKVFKSYYKRGNEPIQSILTEGIKNFSNDESPIEILYDKNIILAFK